MTVLKQTYHLSEVTPQKSKYAAARSEDEDYSFDVDTIFASDAPSTDDSAKSNKSQKEEQSTCVVCY